MHNTQMLVQTQAEKQEHVTAQPPLVHNWQITLHSPNISSAIVLNFCMLFMSCCIWLRSGCIYLNEKITVLQNSLGFAHIYVTFAQSLTGCKNQVSCRVSPISARCKVLLCHERCLCKHAERSLWLCLPVHVKPPIPESQLGRKH